MFRGLLYLLKRAESEAVAIQAVRKREIPRMKAQMKQLNKKRSKLCGYLRTNHKLAGDEPRDHQTQKNPSRQPDTDTWIGFPNLKMPSKHGLQCAPYLVRSLTSLESLCCTKVECATAPRTKFVQCYAKISNRKGDKDSKQVVMDLQCLTRSTRSTMRQQIEEAFKSGELRQALSQLKAGKAAGPDMASDLKHLSMNESSVLLSILNSS